jgi:hypothetical protein
MFEILHQLPFKIHLLYLLAFPFVINNNYAKTFKNIMEKCYALIWLNMRRFSQTEPKKRV